MHRCCLLISSIFLLNACAEPPIPDQVPEHFGVAVRHNMEAQIAYPDQAADKLGPASGVRQSLATRRYQTDQVDAPVEVFTRGE